MHKLVRIFLSLSLAIVCCGCSMIVLNETCSDQDVKYSGSWYINDRYEVKVYEPNNMFTEASISRAEEDVDTTLDMLYEVNSQSRSIDVCRRRTLNGIQGVYCEYTKSSDYAWRTGIMLHCVFMWPYEYGGYIRVDVYGDQSEAAVIREAIKTITVIE